MSNTNEMVLEFDSKSENESFARVVVAAFVAQQLDPTMEELADIKTAVSEAVTNSIIHGYNNSEGKIKVYCSVAGQEVHVEITDQGMGIEDIKRAMEPLYTSRPDLERSGMGFAFMQAFTDHMEVISSPDQGTTIKLDKKIRK